VSSKRPLILECKRTFLWHEDVRRVCALMPCVRTRETLWNAFIHRAEEIPLYTERQTACCILGGHVCIVIVWEDNIDAVVILACLHPT
jgi:hypothetical protein